MPSLPSFDRFQATACAFDEALSRLTEAIEGEPLAVAAPEPIAPASAPWPSLPAEALHGLFGEIVTTISPHTESDDAAVLLQTLVAFGNVITRAPHFRVEADTHALNLFMALVGDTAKGRKGTSWGQVKRLFTAVDQDWIAERTMSGLSSGEGLVWQVRDPIEKSEPIKEKGRYTGEVQTALVDPGVEDKRLLVMETEFANVLAVMRREGNTLSALIRQAWDTGHLRTMTKNNPAKATGAHISIIAHITKDELLRMLETTEAANGFANRFLWVCSKRSQFLPEGGALTEAALAPLSCRLAAAVRFARSVGEIRRDEDARAKWCQVYPALSAGHPGMLGAVTSRAEAITMRLACLYALADHSAVITPAHLTSALAVWEYCEASARFIFGERMGDPVSDEILLQLRANPDGLTRTQIRDLFGRHQSGAAISRTLATLAQRSLARVDSDQTGGRSSERWYAVA